MAHQVKTKTELKAKFKDSGDKLVVIYFFVTWDGPRMRNTPLLDQIAKEKEDKLVMLKVDIDDIEEIVDEYSIKVMPTIVFERKGEHLDTQVGSREDKLRELIEKHLKEFYQSIT